VVVSAIPYIAILDIKALNKIPGSVMRKLSEGPLFAFKAMV
jgi:hypothetical protein